MTEWWAPESLHLTIQVRGVVALTATPAALGHDLREGASQVIHQVYSMEHPANYVGYEFTAAPYAEQKIVHEPVPDRKQIIAIGKSVFYQSTLKRHGWWDDGEDEPRPPFKMRADGAITVRKADLDDTPDGDHGKSAQELADMVVAAHGKSKLRGDKVLESDGVGIAHMLTSMSEKGPAEEPERRALVISNFTRTLLQKQQLASHILNGELTLEDGETRLAKPPVETGATAPSLSMRSCSAFAPRGPHVHSRLRLFQHTGRARLHRPLRRHLRPQAEPHHVARRGSSRRGLRGVGHASARLIGRAHRNQGRLERALRQVHHRQSQERHRAQLRRPGHGEVLRDVLLQHQPHVRLPGPCPWLHHSSAPSLRSHSRIKVGPHAAL